MRKTLSIVSLGVFSLISSQYSYSNCPNGNCGYRGDNYQGQGYYQGQPMQGQGYYPAQPTQGPGYYQSQPMQGQGYYQSQPIQGQGYYQEQRQDRYYQGQQQQDRNYRQQNDYQNNDSRYQSNQRYDDQRNNRRDNENVPDQEIARNIHDALGSGMFSKGYPNVTFNVNDGRVMLTGSVDSQDDKAKVEDSIKKIKGVKQVNNQITVMGKQTSYNDTNDNRDSRIDTRSDSRWDSRENEDDRSYPNKQMSYNESYDDRDSNTRTENRRDSREDSKVRDEEKKYPQDTGTTEADKRLNAKIREKISDGWFSRSYERITLRTNNGVVTIMGFVDSNDDIQKINDKLKGIEGIRTVNNQASVKTK